ncbi:hypothetical protein QUF55_06095 [Clostridiaceae bacterium HSG29]|nr:hypothetical protein [Clostridiaceae bacterium HSG29]
MKINRITNHMEIYKNKEIANLISKSMFNPNEGKIQNIAESIYSKQQGMFFTAEVDNKVIGIIGLNRINPKRAEILNFSVDENENVKAIEKEIIENLRLILTDTKIVIEIDDSEVKKYRKMGFEAKKMPSDILGCGTWKCII